MEKKKKISPVIIILIIVLIIGGIVTGIFVYKSQRRNNPEKTLNSFVRALNHNDINGMLDCIEPTEAELIELGLKKIDEATDSEIAGKLKDYLPFLSAYLKVDIFPEFEIEITNTDIDGEKAVVTIDINESKQYYNIYMIELDDKWYIQYALKSDSILETVKKITKTSLESGTGTKTGTVTSCRLTTGSGTTTTRKVMVTTVREEIPDGELVRVLDYIPDVVTDIRYATTNNFTGTVIYEDSEAYLCYGTVKKLAKVQEALKEKGFRIIIWDAYRPEEAQYKLWEVCPDPTYVADPRNGITSHSRGNTIDLGIVYSDGSEVELPSGFDEFSLLADRNYSDVSEEAAENSRMLEEIMTTYGFSGYWGEWWHYSDQNIYTVTPASN